MIELLDKKVRIAVLGDAMTDVYVHGSLEDCQDNCKKFVETSRVVVPGGAANAARSLSGWSCQVVPIVRGTSIKTRFLDDNRCVMRHDSASKRVIPFSVKVPFSVYSFDAVLVSDYDKGFLTDTMLRRVIDKCKEAGVPCVADVKRAPSCYEGAILKGNFAYALKYPKSLRIVTNGASGPIVDSQKRYPQMSPVPCVNHVGAGDCFAAHLALALACDLPLEEAAAVAHSAGRVYVQHPHNRPPLPAEIEADYALRR